MDHPIPSSNSSWITMVLVASSHNRCCISLLAQVETSIKTSSRVLLARVISNFYFHPTGQRTTKSLDITLADAVRWVKTSLTMISQASRTNKINSNAKQHTLSSTKHHQTIKKESQLESWRPESQIKITFEAKNDLHAICLKFLRAISPFVAK